MAIRCEVPSATRKDYGFGENFVKGLRLGKDLSGEQLQALAKNLGVDDIRAVELRGDKAHLFGKNLGDVDYWKGGEVPSDTIVKKQNPDGELEYFIANRKATSEPTKWVLEDGKNVKPNPEWIYVGKNATLDEAGQLKRFSRGDKGVYYPDDAGDVVLKVTKPYDASEGPVPSIRSLAEKGYDAIGVDGGGYKLVHEPTQAVNRNSVLINQTKGTAHAKQVDEIKPQEVTEAEVEQRIKNYELTKGLGYGVAGYASGEIADNWLDTENFGWAGGAIGMMLGAPKVRGKLSGIFTGKAGNLTDQGKALSEVDAKHKEWKELTQDGYAGDPNDSVLKEQYRTEIMSRKEKLKSAGKQVWDFIFDNNMFGSAFGRLGRIGGPLVDRLERIFRGLETHHTTLVRDHYNTVDRVFGRNVTDREFRTIQRDAVRRYMSDVGATKEYTDAELDDLWGAAVRRIITFGTTIGDDGAFKFADDMKAASKEYSSEVTREIDSYFLRDEDAIKAINAWRQTFDKYGKDAIKTYRQSVLKYVNNGELNSAQSRLLLNILDSELSFNQWKENIPAGLAKTYKDSLENEVFAEAIGYIERINKIQALEGRYIPQMRSGAKETRIRQRVLEEFDRANPNATERQRYEHWRSHRINQILAHNKEAYKALRLSASGDNVEPILKRNEMDLVSELKNHLVYNIQDQKVRAQVIEELENVGPRTVDKYIGKTMRGGKPMYYIKDPEIKLPDGTVYPFLDDVNKGILDQADRAYMNITTALQSDHLDNPRNFIMPTNMVETNLETVMRRYSQDAGNKLYLVENNLDTKRKVKRYLDDIKSDLEERGYGGERVRRDLETVESWYNNMTNTSDAIEINMSADDILRRHENKTKTRKILETLGNFGYMPFLWFTSFYSMFQPFITGPFMAKHGNIWSEYKQMFKDPESLKNATDNMRKWGIIQDKAKSFSPEVDFGADLYSDGGILDWFHNISKKGVNFSANFSLTKKILEHPSIGIDIDNGGFLRFLGGSMLDIAGAESAITTMAVLREVEDMVEAGAKLMGDANLTEAVGGGKSFRMGQIRRRLEELGVDNVERFIRESSEVNSTIGQNQIKGFRQQMLGKTDAGFELPEYLIREYNKMSDTIVNQLHGRTKLSRPLWWTNNPYGRLLSQFSVYSQNIAIQSVGQRIASPIKDWFTKYQMPEDQSVMKVMWAMKNKDDAYIKQVFGDQWREAYDDFPVDAFNNIFKVMPVVMGTGAVMMATRDSFMDFINLMGNEAIGNDDHEAWRATKENYAYLSDLFDDDDVALGVIEATRGALHNAVDMGFAGRLGQVFINESRYTQGGLWSKTPVTGMINDGYEAVTTPFRYSAEDALPQTAKAISEQMLLRTPIIGSFHDFRKGLVNTVFSKPKNRDVSFTDSETGLQLTDLQIMGE